MMMNQVRLLSVVEWQVRRPGAVAQPVVAFQSWLPIGCHHHRPATKTYLPSSDGQSATYGNYLPPLQSSRCSRSRHWKARWRSIDGFV